MGEKNWREHGEVGLFINILEESIYEKENFFQSISDVTSEYTFQLNLSNSQP